MKLESAGFARIRDYVGMRFDVATLQRFVDDPAKHNGSVRDALALLLSESGPDVFTLADYARQMGATLIDSDAVLSGAISAPGSYLCRVPFASDAGVVALKDLVEREKHWFASRRDDDPLKLFDSEQVRLSPLLLVGTVLARNRIKERPQALSDLGADRFCLDAENLIEKPHPLSRRVGGLLLRFAA